MEQVSLSFEDIGLARSLFGQHQANLKGLAHALGIHVHSRGNTVALRGDTPLIELGAKILTELAKVAREGHTIVESDVERAVKIAQSGGMEQLRGILSDTILTSSNNRLIAPKSLAQKAYVDAIRQSGIVIGIGPAGTGKTYLAIAMAVAALKNKKVNRIVLTRPAVETGEKLGFLPGDIAEKVHPYVRPLYDALHDMLGYEGTARLMEQGTIEVAPLAFMRGRTLNDSFVVFDEAQNSTCEQMKMFLTRLAPDSQAVITGDVTQIDLPEKQKSGLIEAQEVLSTVEGIGFCYFAAKDVVRHRLVQDIIVAYEKAKVKNSSHKKS